MKTLLTTFLLLLAYSLSAQINLEEGLVAYYPFAGDFTDHSSFENDATIVSGATLTFGYSYLENEAVIFDGINDYVEIPHANQINFPNQTAFSISFWIQIPEEQQDAEGAVTDIISKWSNFNGPYPYVVRVYNQNAEDNGRIAVGIYQSVNAGCSSTFTTSIVSDKRINDTKWHHVLLSRTAENLFRLYIDCQLEGEVAADANCVVTNNARLLLGMRIPGGPTFTRAFTGAMDELRMYDRVLNPEELGIVCVPVSTTNRDEPARAGVVYPNPVRARQPISVEVSDGEQIESFKMYGSHGSYLGEYELGQTLDVPAGIYHLIFNFTDATQAVSKLMVID